MAKSLIRRFYGYFASNVQRSHTLGTTTSIRRILSDAYLCNEAWKSRLSSKSLAKIKMGEFYTGLDKKLTQLGYIDAIDLDLFANNITKEDQLYELEDLVHRFRRTPQTVSIFSSTIHATVRSFLQFDYSQTLLRILQDKHSYGIFPDTYCYNILMDYFIKKGNFKDATKIVSLMMLQEDLGDDISGNLAFCCFQKLIQEGMPPPYVKEVKEEEEVDEDEIEWVRVHFLRDEYYDDHFDIENDTLLLGKSMWTFGQSQPTPLGFTFQLLGLCFYQKWEKLLQLMDVVLEKKHTVTKEGIELVKKHISELPELEESVKTDMQEKMNKLTSANLIVESTLEELVNEQIGEIDEASGIQKQLQTYDSWNEKRMNEIQKQIDKFIRLERIKKIEMKKKELKEKEDYLFFFENFDKIKRELETMKAESESDVTKQKSL